MSGKALLAVDTENCCHQLQLGKGASAELELELLCACSCRTAPAGAAATTSKAARHNMAAMGDLERRPPITANSRCPAALHISCACRGAGDECRGEEGAWCAGVWGWLQLAQLGHLPLLLSTQRCCLNSLSVRVVALAGEGGGVGTHAHNLLGPAGAVLVTYLATRQASIQPCKLVNEQSEGAGSKPIRTSRHSMGRSVLSRAGLARVGAE